MVRKSKDDIPQDLLDAFNEEVPHGEEESLFDQDITMDPHKLESLLRKEDKVVANHGYDNSEEDSDFESKRRSKNVSRFRRERAEADRDDDHITEADRELYANSAKGSLYIDPNSIPGHSQWLWAARSVRNNGLDANMRQLFREGWVEVDEEEYRKYDKSYKNQARLEERFGMSRSDGLVQVGESVLMKQPKTQYKKKMQLQEEGSKMTRRKVEEMSNRMGARRGAAGGMFVDAYKQNRSVFKDNN